MKLPQIEPPSGLSARVLARIAQVESGEAVSMAGAQRSEARPSRDWITWLAVTAIAAGAVIVTSGYATTTATAVDVFTPPGPDAIRALTTGALTIGAGLVLFLSGLYLPTLSPRRSPRPPGF